MTAISDAELRTALKAALDQLPIPAPDVTRIVQASACTALPQPTPNPRRVRIGIAAAVAALFVLIVASDLPRSNALAITTTDRIKATIERVLGAFNGGPPHAVNVMFQSEDGLPLPVIGRDLPFPIVPPAGIPHAFLAGNPIELKSSSTRIVEWSYTRKLRNPAREMIRITESLHGTLHPSVSDGTAVAMKFDPNGRLLSAVRVQVDVKRRAVEQFTIGKTDVSVVVTDDHPQIVADAIRAAMSGAK